MNNTKNLINNARKLLTYEQTKPNETKARFAAFYAIRPENRLGLFYGSWGLNGSTSAINYIAMQSKAAKQYIPAVSGC